ncbi:MAG: polyprenyl synthetase family protein [Bacteroidales bacterium OttesenSCG-928-I14]|jgi:octaprenyl-diphosphate synthase|nr:polyprenyl synthetase family protein [Bacteroidales bacterium OttesenSCG-928-I14]
MLESITQFIQKELNAFDKLYIDTLRTSTKNIQNMLDFVLNKNGKRIRPIVLILSAKLCGNPITKTLEYAVILELLHVATLIHDDVVDNTNFRRGSQSAMVKFGNKIAVLLGDYIISKAIKQVVKTKNYTVIKTIANLAQDLCKGELMQLTLSNRNISECNYFEIIKKKTAILFSACSKIGALSVDADKKKTQTLKLIGENLGICFQIKDDLFDYSSTEKLGKPTKNDIKNGKITLPLIYALQTAPKSKSKFMMSIIEKQDFSSENINKLINFSKEQKGTEYAHEKMLEIKMNTIALLNNFPSSKAKTYMIKLIDYIIERKQ